MHRLLYIVFLILFALPIQAQSEETNRILSYIQKAMNFNKVVPQEKVYLHFDNMGYFEKRGDVYQCGRNDRRREGAGE